MHLQKNAHRVNNIATSPKVVMYVLLARVSPCDNEGKA